MLETLTSFINGSVFKELKEGIMAYFPPDISPQQKQEAELKLQQLLIDKQARINEVIRQSEESLNKRIAEQEGTASDLKSLPVLGRVILFARGAQRPMWGYATLLLDYKWFFGNYTFTDKQQTALIVINILVLGFLFGERAVQNLTPMIVQVFGKK